MRDESSVAGPRISIVVATSNAAATLGRLLDSYCRQSYDRSELIVVDNASTDGTVEMLRQRSDLVDRLVSEPDRGIYDAWNKGVARARGEWIAFLGADDEFASPTALASVAERLGNRTTARVAYGDAEAVDEEGGPVWRIERPWQEERKRFLQGVMRLPHPGMFHHRSLFDEGRRFDPSFRIAGDYDLLLSVLKEEEAQYLQGLTVVRISYAGISRVFDNRFRVMAEVLRSRRRQGVRGIPWAWLWLGTKSLLRVGIHRLLGERISRWVVDRYRTHWSWRARSGSEPPRRSDL